MIRAVLWDFGGVILTSPFDAFSRYERERNLPDGFLRRVNATNPDTNAWARLERSEVGIDEFCALFEAEAVAAGHAVDARAVLAMLEGEVRPQMVEAVRRCRERLRVALVTNNFLPPDGQPNGEAAPLSVMRPDLADVVSLFHVVVESSRTGLRKPDPRIYELACEELGVRPDEAVFLDDLGVNLRPARAMGMTTIKVTDPDVALAELEGALGFSLR